MIRLICGNCGTKGLFKSWEQAFEESWDTIERFGYNACNRCPGVSVLMPMMYAQQARETDDPEKRAALLEKAALATLEFEPKTR